MPSDVHRGCAQILTWGKRHTGGLSQTGFIEYGKRHSTPEQTKTPMKNLSLVLPLLAAMFIQSPASAQAQQSVAGLPRPALAQTNRAIRFDAAIGKSEGSLVLPLASEADLAQRSAGLDDVTRAGISAALRTGNFKYAPGSSLSLRGVGPWRRVLIVGLRDKPGEAAFQTAGAATGRALMRETGEVTILAAGLNPAQTADLATGIGLGEYRADIYGTVDRQPSATDAVTVIADDPAGARQLFATQGEHLVKALTWTRDISNEPANVVYPESFVERARKVFSGLAGVQIEVLDTAAMERLGMGSLLGVGRGSQRAPRMLIIRYTGASAAAHAPVVLVGKGITFDTGGISLKPGASMGDMKFDMSGAASVTGAVLSLAGSRAPVNVVAIAALAENMPDGAAIRPGDILRAMNGRTIEIVSTDAEGRLVLADALAWADAELKPAAIVDVATLTGAIVTALGDDYAGLFSRDDALAGQIQAAGKMTGEAIWRMPLHDSYAKDLASDYADLKNGGSGPGGGIGAHFIGEFVSKQTPWAHIDIAGVAWGKANDTGPAGSTGWGVRLLDRFVRDFTPVAAAGE